jgi:hypothetical protein
MLPVRQHNFPDIPKWIPIAILIAGALICLAGGIKKNEK